MLLWACQIEMKLMVAMSWQPAFPKNSYPNSAN
jgi:hypothetical protein